MQERDLQVKLKEERKNAEYIHEQARLKAQFAKQEEDIINEEREKLMNLKSQVQLAQTHLQQTKEKRQRQLDEKKVVTDD
ncbi:hypothetical protein HDV02_005447 [Globomyces sp. JEL0801]|nr:hypothetical protein HDV02_005447 [Globomyces sp. JEL0801]